MKALMKKLTAQLTARQRKNRPEREMHALAAEIFVGAMGKRALQFE